MSTDTINGCCSTATLHNVENIRNITHNTPKKFDAWLYDETGTERNLLYFTIFKPQVYKPLIDKYGFKKIGIYRGMEGTVAILQKSLENINW